MTETLFNNTDGIISYVTSKIEKYAPNRFEEQVKYYINHYCEKYLKVKIPAQHINNFYIIHYLTIRDIVKDEEHRREVEMERERMADYDVAVRIAREDLLSKVHKNKNKLSFNQVKRLNSFKPLLDEDIRHIYDEYEREWEEVHKNEEPKVRKETFGDKLDKFVVEHMNDDLLTYDNFVKVTSGWNRGRRSINNWYEDYKRKYFQQPGTTIKYDKIPFTGLFGYKSKDKINALKLINPELKEEKGKIPSSFPLKQNIKHYQLHKVAEKNTWMIDLMFCGKLGYLVAINVNTKYLFVELLNDVVGENEFSKGTIKSTVSYLRALNRMIEKGANVKHLTGDGEGSFNSKLAWETFYNSRGIDFKPVTRQVMGNYPDFMKKEQEDVKNDPLHSSLGIIDRVIRTIRDMAYNMKIGVITPEVMNEIVNQYNNAPHRGLSKWAGFSVTPKMVNDDPELENYSIKSLLYL